MPAEDSLANDESITRFVYDKDDVSRLHGRVKPGAFLPSFEKDVKRWETSVCRVEECSEDRIWHLARTQRPERTIKARADLLVQSAIDAKLSCMPLPVQDYPEHAVLLGWPDEKPAQREIALVLSKKSKAVFPPDD